MPSDWNVVYPFQVPVTNCRFCANPNCPYPTDADYRAKIESDPSWRLKKDCWMPFPDAQRGIQEVHMKEGEEHGNKAN